MNKNDIINKILVSDLEKSKNNDIHLTQAQSLLYKNRIKDELIEALNGAMQTAKENPTKLKILFIEHNHYFDNFYGERKAYLCGFGDGDFSYPILETPEYVKYNYQSELFNGFGEIKFDFEDSEMKEEIKKEYLKSLENQVKTNEKPKTEEEEEFWEDIPEDDLIQIDTCLVNLFLHEVFCELDESGEIDKSKMEDEVFIYANLHDYPASNIYIIENNKK